MTLSRKWMAFLLCTLPLACGSEAEIASPTSVEETSQASGQELEDVDLGERAPPGKVDNKSIYYMDVWSSEDDPDCYSWCRGYFSIPPGMHSDDYCNDGCDIDHILEFRTGSFYKIGWNTVTVNSEGCLDKNQLDCKGCPVKGWAQDCGDTNCTPPPCP
jgi:hypothetical protein